MNERRILVAGATLAALGVATLGLAVFGSEESEANETPVSMAEPTAEVVTSSTMEQVVATAPPLQPAPATAVAEPVPPTDPTETEATQASPPSPRLRLSWIIAEDGAALGVRSSIEGGSCANVVSLTWIVGGESIRDDDCKAESHTFELEFSELPSYPAPGVLPVTVDATVDGQAKQETIGVDVPCRARYVLVVPYPAQPSWLEEVCVGDSQPAIADALIAMATIDTATALCALLPQPGDVRYQVVDVADPKNTEVCG